MTEFQNVGDGRSIRVIANYLGTKYDLKVFRGDLFGGVTAAIVGLPVALAFGVSAFGIEDGIGPKAGLYGAIAVGFFAALLGGTRSQISGPTAPMAIAMAAIITITAGDDLAGAPTTEALAKAFTIVIMAGILQILLGALGIGRFVAYTPYSVISGFMSGIGFTVMILQLAPFLGTINERGGALAAISNWPEAISNADFRALIVAAVTLAVGVFWPKRLSQYVPATLVALLSGTAIAVFWLDVPTIGEVPSGLPSIQIPTFSFDFLLTALQPALIIALLGSIDSLLTSLIADSLTRTRHDPNRELIGQGIGNTVAGFIGGLPGAGATLGTVVNIRAGGQTQISGAIRALILLILVLGIGQYLEVVPLAALAGILVKVGWDIVDWRFITRIHRVQREHLVVMAITMLLTFFLGDLTIAVAIGLIAAGIAASRQWERLELDSVISIPILDTIFFAGRKLPPGVDDYSAHVGMVALRGTFTVASSHRIIATIGDDIKEHDVVILDFSDTKYIDDSAALVVEQMIHVAIDEETSCIVMGLEGTPAATLESLNVLSKVPEDRFAKDLDEAREIARQLLIDNPPSHLS